MKGLPRRFTPIIVEKLSDIIGSDTIEGVVVGVNWWLMMSTWGGRWAMEKSLIEQRRRGRRLFLRRLN
ncbi:hypothetical protein TorRG33x02_140320 [Trema orientale]|uniref:Uncharacterized protein n=1 Tax=Trema orientale TaxID=63057 RepID=A0A2P5EXB4_TREOI|nr:hypothetical protein TorRG33x02_140320 [Trema orientale]